jgi:hypothetical protein
MLEIIALIYLSRKIGLLAIQKGLKPLTWKLYTIAAWIICEIIGIILAVSLFGQNIFSIMSIGLASAFGGYLLVRAILEKKPDIVDNDINSIGSGDHTPPTNS